MGKPPLWKISVSISGEAEEAAFELLERIFQQPASIHVDARTGATKASVFLSNPKLLAASKLRDFKVGVAAIRSYGINVGTGRIRVQEVKHENWAESWKKHFPPLEIGRKLLVKPPWSKRRARKQQRVLVLNPGLSFGTGQHPTTRFCLDQLAGYRVPERPQSFLDLGSGSGILAIAAAKLGYKPVVGVDYDPAAVKIAKSNARKNRVKVKFCCADLTNYGRQGWGMLRHSAKNSARYHVVCANLVYDLLLAEKIRISQTVVGGGVLVLAGILQRQFEAVRKSYEQLGFKLVRSRGEKEWKSAAFVRPIN